jgi:hypothetical protein
MTVATAFHTASTDGSITLFMTSRTVATGRNGGSAGGGSAGAGAEQPAYRDAAISNTAATARP